MNLFFEQVNELNNSIFSAYEGEPLMAFLTVFITVGCSFVPISIICAFYDITPKSIWKKIVGEESETPKELKPLIKPQTNRDFTIEMLKLRKKTLKEIGYDPMCPENATEEERIAADRLAATLECLVNKYPDPDEFDKALSKINNTKEN